MHHLWTRRQRDAAIKVISDYAFGREEHLLLPALVRPLTQATTARVDAATATATTMRGILQPLAWATRGEQGVYNDLNSALVVLFRLALLPEAPRDFGLMPLPNVEAGHVAFDRYALAETLIGKGVVTCTMGVRLRLRG